MERGEAGANSLGQVALASRRKVAFLLQKPEVEQAAVYNLFKEFFKAYLQKPYEFTAEELTQELRRVYVDGKVRAQVEELAEKLGLIEYTETQYSQAELRHLLEDLDTVIKSLVVEHKESIPFLVRVAHFLHRKPKQKPVADAPGPETAASGTATPTVTESAPKEKPAEPAGTPEEAPSVAEQLGLAGTDNPALEPPATDAAEESPAGTFDDLFGEQPAAAPETRDEPEPATEAEPAAEAEPTSNPDWTSEMPEDEHETPTEVKVNTHLEEIYAALQRGEKAKALSEYKALSSHYELLPTEVQHEFYQKILEAYKAITS